MLQNTEKVLIMPIWSLQLLDQTSDSDYGGVFFKKKQTNILLYGHSKASNIDHNIATEL